MTNNRDDKTSTAPSCRPGLGLEAAGPSAAGIGADARRRIGRDLRLLYGSILDRPLSERFTRLIEKLVADPQNRKDS